MTNILVYSRLLCHLLSASVLSILFLKCWVFFFKVPSFLSNIFNCMKTYITRDSIRYKVCSTFEGILDVIWLLFYVVGNITHWRILFKSWMPGFEMEQLLLGRTSRNCVWSMWSCVFGFYGFKSLRFLYMFKGGSILCKHKLFSKTWFPSCTVFAHLWQVFR